MTDQALTLPAAKKYWYLLLPCALLLFSCHTGRNLSSAAARAPQERFINDMTLTHSKARLVIYSNSSNEYRKPINIPVPKGDTIARFQRDFSDLLRVTPGRVQDTALYNFIKDWLGVRYHIGGVTKSGVDCSGFVQKLYDQVFCTKLTRTAAAQHSLCHPLESEQEAHEGDLVFFKIKSSNISHVGVYLSNDYFVHASVSQGVMISNLRDPYWKKYFAGVGSVQKELHN